MVKLIQNSLEIHPNRSKSIPSHSKDAKSPPQAMQKSMQEWTSTPSSILDRFWLRFASPIGSLLAWGNLPVVSCVGCLRSLQSSFDLQDVLVVFPKCSEGRLQALTLREFPVGQLQPLDFSLVWEIELWSKCVVAGDFPEAEKRVASCRPDSVTCSG